MDSGFAPDPIRARTWWHYSGLQYLAIVGAYLELPHDDYVSTPYLLRNPRGLWKAGAPNRDPGPG